jgi:hypothetical protein
MQCFARWSLQAVWAALVLAAPMAHAAPVSLFSETFEGPLSQWTVHEQDAFIAPDPLQGGNRVLDFADKRWRQRDQLGHGALDRQLHLEF